jgi:hypothetical protein
MQNFRVNPGEAQKIHFELFGVVDDDWDMLVEGEEHAISDGYDLTAKDNRISLYRTLRTLDGQDYKALLGDIPLNKVSITRWHPDTCNCLVTKTWDRRTNDDWADTRDYNAEDIVVHGGKSWQALADIPEDSNEEPGVSKKWAAHSDVECRRVEHPHKSERRCKDHAHFQPHDHINMKNREHHDELLSENRHKNDVVNALGAHLEVSPSEIVFKHRIGKTGARELHVDHPLLADPRVRGTAEAHVREQAPDRKVIFNPHDPK